MDVFPRVETSEDSVRPRPGVRLDFFNAIRFGSAGQPIMEVFEAVTARYVVLELLPVAVEDLLRLKKFGLAYKYSKHVPTTRPTHKVEVDFGKDGLHAASALSNVCPPLFLCGAGSRFRNLRL